jgi:acyl carrier protein
VGLDSVEIILALEERFQIEIPDRRASTTRTVGDLEELVLRLREEQLPAETRRAHTEEEIRAAIRAEIADQLNVNPARVTPDADLVHDLGMDC